MSTVHNHGQPESASEAQVSPQTTVSAAEMPPPYTGMHNPQPYQPGQEHVPPTLYAPGHDKHIHEQPIGVSLQPGTTTYIITGDPMLSFGLHRPMSSEPMQGQCPQCNQIIVTRIEYEVGSHGQGLMCLFCLLGGLLCCWIPLCVPSMQDVIHSCPNCNAPLGRFNR